jgi:hypothetical protein
MSIGIAIAVPDGIALAADTQTTWNRTITTARDRNTGQEVELAEPIQLPVGWSQMARKLFSVDMNGKQFAIVSAGMAHLNTKSMFAIFRSGAQNYQGDGSFTDASQYFVNHIKNELANQYSCTVEALPQQAISACEFIIAGYEEGDVGRPVLESHIVYSGTLIINNNPDPSGHFLKWTNMALESRYGGCWIGRSAFIGHIVNHTNPELPPISGQYSFMTLSDAINYTKFLVEFTCDFQRFAIMVPDCGRPVTSATLTPERYEETVAGSVIAKT